jgi:hypothetical protein
MKDRAWSATEGSMLVGMKPAAPASKAAQTSLGSSRSESTTSGVCGISLRAYLINVCCGGSSTEALPMLRMTIAQLAALCLSIELTKSTALTVSSKAPAHASSRPTIPAWRNLFESMITTWGFSGRLPEAQCARITHLPTPAVTLLSQGRHSPKGLSGNLNTT